MRLAFIALLAATALQFMPRPASAETYYPWCSYIDDWTYNCGFTTLAQCRAAASGDGGFCRLNPYPAPVRAEPLRRKRVQRAY
jgi:hypothetical protein